ncbi:hypothetical protein E2320_006625 [Naja naja]|nr:hypothetical protein E2320_006625 [Naja naja]
MGDPRELCPHLDCIGEGTCQSCGAGGPNLWACLQVGCHYVGCGESFADHSTLHAQAKKHNLTVNLTTFRVWCYACEKEVFLDQNLASHPTNLPSKFMEQDILPPAHPSKPFRLPSLTKENRNRKMTTSNQEDTQEFLRCLMDQLHEELKEPMAAELRDSDTSDTDEKREGDRSPSEDEFLSCDSSSDRGEGDGQSKAGSAEAELLIQEEAGRSISEKERMKERKFSCHQRRSNSEQVDEDADIDTSVMAVEGGASPEGLLPPPPRPASPARTPEPDNDAYPRCSSRPCSPVHHDVYAKLSNPPHSSPVRLGPSYVLKKDLSLPIPGKEDLAKLHSAIYQNVTTCTAVKGVLCIHLKRFRHEVMYSFKINSHVSFPLEGLDLRPFLAKESISKVTNYDLLSVICHHGTAGSGHYIAYCQNMISGQWYEFDDQYVTEVHETVVQNAEAYVLFYRKSSEEAVRERQKVVSLATMKEPGLLQFYISREWLNKFNTFTEPGPISNHTFLCSHGGIPPNKYHYIDDLVVILPQNVWEYLYNRFGGGPAVNHLYVCSVCQVEIEALAKRRKMEIDTFIKVTFSVHHHHHPGAGLAEECPSVIFCISMQWFREWEAFVKGKDNEPPGPIDNTKIAVAKGSGHMQVKQGADYGQISEETWIYLSTLYGGGPEIAIRQNVAQVQEVESLHGEQKIEAETRAV